MTSPMTAYEAVVTKRDLRWYTDDHVPAEVLERILQAGRMAGSAKNEESNRLLLVTDPTVKAELAACGDYSSWIASAAAIIGIAAPSTHLRLFDVGRQAQNMMIIANAEGIGTCPVTLHNAARTATVVRLPDDWEMPLVITFGCPAQDHPDSPLKRRRLNLDQLVIRDRFT